MVIWYEARSRNQDYNPREEAVNLAKLVYTPIITLVIYLGADSFADGELKHFSTVTEGTIIFSFVLGFFSARVVELLTKLKNALLPSLAESVSDIGGFTVGGTVGVTGATLPLQSKVKLQMKSTPYCVFHAEAGADGAFTFSHIPPGTYTLEAIYTVEATATAPAKIFTHKETILVNANLLNRHLDLT